METPRAADIPGERLRGDFHLPSDARGPVDELASLINRLKLLVLIRVLTLTTLSIVTALFELQDQHTILAGSSDRFLYSLTTGVFLVSLGSLAVLQFVPVVRLQRIHAYTQVMLDLLFVAMLVMITRLTDSVFVFLFSLVIVAASIILSRRGALLAAAVASGLLLLIGFVQLNLGSAEQFLDSMGAPEEFLLRHAELATLSTQRGVAYNISVNVLAFFAIGLLTAYLAEQLRHTGQVLRQNRQSFRELEALHRHVVESLPVALVTTDREFRVTYVNSVARGLCGFEPGEMQGRPITLYFPDLSAILGNEDKRHHSEVTAQILSGQHIRLRWTISPLLTAEGERFGQLLVFQDVTKLLKLEADAKRRDRLATIGKLAAGIAHEIRNPLASISGSIQLLRDTAELAEQERRLMNIVVRETDSLNERITEFLAYARPRKLDRRRTNLSELVFEAMEVFRNDPRSDGRRLHTDASLPGETRADVDQDGFRRVLWNLLCNAAEATDPGDEVEIGLEEFVHEGRAHACLWVRDTGAGMTAEDLKRATEPFYTTKEGGTGLGLSMVQRIVEEHGGFLTIESVEGSGTRFGVNLPVETVAEEMEDEEDSERSEATGANLPIILPR